uniref:Flavodoxin-like domain-containing protein n=1 Tax=Heterorhabditis bacteriophora TaxID=37862 RepID=A0A1I7XGG7_HETBA
MSFLPYQKKPNVKTAFIPLWWPHEKATNMAKGIKNTLDAESLFSHGGFGDLAMTDAEASADYTRKLTSNVQHFDMVTVLHSPDINNVLDTSFYILHLSFQSHSL